MTSVATALHSLNEKLGRIDGPIVMIGFGSIGRGTLPLLERHLEFDPKRLVVIDPEELNRKLLDERNIHFIRAGLTAANYRDILTPLRFPLSRSTITRIGRRLAAHRPGGPRRAGHTPGERSRDV